MIGTLITSQTRIKLLKKFFLNSKIISHLRGLETEFGESTNAIRVELNRLENAGFLTSCFVGNKKLYQANSDHPLYTDIHNIILKETGIDQVIEKVIHRIGNLMSIYLTGDLAKGKEGKIIELILVGTGIDNEYLSRKVTQARQVIKREISYVIINPSEVDTHPELLRSDEFLLLWNNGGETMV